MTNQSDKIYILYPSGAHGGFLILLLNHMLGNKSSLVDYCTYDRIVFQSSPFVAVHHLREIPKHARAITIKVDQSSYLKYIAICMNRTNEHNIIIEDLDKDTIKKLENHPIFNFFLKALSKITGQLTPNIEKKYLREWARVCFFNNNGKTITQMIQSSQGDLTLHDKLYCLNFESFYDNSITNECKKILEYCNLDPKNTDLTVLLNHFNQHNRYKTIDQDIQNIINHIMQLKNIPIGPLNFLSEAWIDSWLEQTYGTTILLKNNYFTNTQQIIDQYELHKQPYLLT